MLQDIRKLALKIISRKGSVKVSEITRATGYTRAYVHRILKQLCDEGILMLIGKANKAHYIDAKTNARDILLSQDMNYIHRILRNDGTLQEDKVLEEVKKNSGIFFQLPRNVIEIIDYAFTEMLNNAIEHSKSKTIDVVMKRISLVLKFVVTDKGVGIFNNIKSKKNLSTITDAIRDLLKGRQTTMPERHSGEGIFFTSRSADRFVIKSSGKMIIYDNNIKDVSVKDCAFRKGTQVMFEIKSNAKKRLMDIFNRYTDENYRFDKTEVAVRLYSEGTEYVSRSQARRLLSGLESFKRIILDFKGLPAIGQAFADEIFRVWQRSHPDIEIKCINVTPAVNLMIEMAKTESTL